MEEDAGNDKVTLVVSGFMRKAIITQKRAGINTLPSRWLLGQPSVLLFLINNSLHYFYQRSYQYRQNRDKLRVYFVRSGQLTPQLGHNACTQITLYLAYS